MTTDNRSCPYCGGQVPGSSPRCPTCGAQAPVQPVQPAPPAVQLQAQQAFAAPPFQVPHPPPQVDIDSLVAAHQRTSKIWSFLGSAIVVLLVGGGIYFGVFGMTFFGMSCGGPPTPIVLNMPVQGELTTFRTSQTYQLDVASPTMVTISVDGGFDNYLELYQGDSSSPMMQDDDSGSGLNAMLTTTLQAGTYVILVRPFSDGTGPYTLTVTGAPFGVPAMPAGVPMQPWAPVQPGMPGYAPPAPAFPVQ